MDRPLVIVTEPLAEGAAEWLAARCEVVRARPEESAFAEAAQRASGLVVRTYTQVDGALLDRLPQLKVVGRAGVGLDNIDLAATAARGITVHNTPDANTQAVVEYVLCLLCDSLRPRVFLDQPVAPDIWNEIRSDVVGLWQMDELVLGVLGLGRIGKRVAQVARAIGFEVVYHDLLDIPTEHRHGATTVEVEALFAESDIVSIHIDGRPENRHFVGANLLEFLRPDAILINTSRGMVLDHDALAAYLRANPGAQALLDVHDPEPFTAENPLLALPNAHLAPHLASRTETAMENMSWVVRDVVASLSPRGQ
ncbi:MAG: NAD(P)-dependent oxidoreductase [Planctomycetota bacterium]|nr:NAD(P)-dependent oxidoreductase [Planctomycetota bacterium]MDA1105556.1 NAD(P)-dependent oxidoreductase [Planctomycetota bacterium]